MASVLGSAQLPVTPGEKQQGLAIRALLQVEDPAYDDQVVTSLVCGMQFALEAHQGIADDRGAVLTG